MLKPAHVLTLSLLSLVAAACAGPAPGTGGPATSEPKYGGVVKGLIDYDLSTVDPSGQFRDVICCLVPMVYNTLIGTEVGPDVKWSDRNLVPELAERWEVSPDARTYTFHLRKGVKFANKSPVNGRELNAEDVAQSYLYWARAERYKDMKPPSRNAFMFQGMDRIDTPDPYTVQVRFKEPFAPFLSYSSDDSLPIAPKELHDAPGGLADNAIGTGPFQLDKGRGLPGSRMVFTKNPDYWEPGKPYLDEFWNLIIEGDGPKEAAFISRQFDIYLPRSDSSAGNIRRAYPQAKILEAQGNRFADLQPNTRIPPLNDVRVRRALALAIDRDEIMKTLYQGKGIWALAGATLGLFTEEETRQVLKHDPEAAKRLVAEAGYANGVEFEWIYPTEYGDLYDSRAQLIQAQVKKANINLRLRPTTQVEYSQRRATTDQHQISGSRPGLVADVGALLESSFAAGTPGNNAGVNDPKIEAWIKAQRGEADPTKRREIVREAVRYINAEMAYGLGLTYEPAFALWQPDLMNFYPTIWNGLQGTPVANIWRDR